MDFIAGMVVIAVGVIHIIFGEHRLLADLRAAGETGALVGPVRIISLQGGAVLLFVGVLHFMISMGAVVLNGLASFIPLGLICLNLSVFLVTAAFIHRELLRQNGVQLTLFAVIIALQVMALR